jgi:hypothetical protein
MISVYTIKVALRGVSPMVWRRLRLSGATSLAQLHYMIQAAMDWDDDNLHHFRIYAEDYGIYRRGGTNYADDPNDIFLDDFEFEPGDRFVYNYNYFENHVQDIRIEAVNSLDQHTYPPRCIGGSRLTNRGSWAPPEFPFEPVSSVDDLSVGELIERLTFIAESCKPTVFSIRKVNQRLFDADTPLV